uniref:Ubiquitin-like protease family profile domain-containing protein n=1 Tax=Oryza glumipatula TaxID=40148 RepID=A0A0E0AXA5_9ORYZ
MTHDGFEQPDLIRWLMDRTDPKTMTIQISENKKIAITPWKISIVLGTPFGGEPLQYPDKKCMAAAFAQLANELGVPPSSNISVPMLKSKLEHRKDDPTAVRFFIMILTNKLLLPSTSFYITKKDAWLGMDLSRVARIDWSKAVFDLLRDSLVLWHKTDSHQSSQTYICSSVASLVLLYIDNLDVIKLGLTIDRLHTPRIQLYTKDLVEAISQGDRVKDEEDKIVFGQLNTLLVPSSYQLSVPLKSACYPKNTRKIQPQSYVLQKWVYKRTPHLKNVQKGNEVANNVCTKKPTPFRRPQRRTKMPASAILIQADLCFATCTDIVKSFSARQMAQGMFIDAFADFLSREDMENRPLSANNRIFIPTTISALINIENVTRNDTKDNYKPDALVEQLHFALGNIEMFLPVIHDDHWSLYIINHNQKSFDILDSKRYDMIGGTETQHHFPMAQKTLKRLSDGFQVFMGGKFPKFGNYRKCYIKCPKMAMGSNDCAFYVMRFMEKYNGDADKLLQSFPKVPSDKLRAQILHHLIFNRFNSVQELHQDIETFRVPDNAQ